MATESDERHFDLPIQSSPGHEYTHLRVQVTYLRSTGVTLEVFSTKVTGALSSIPFWSKERGNLLLEVMQRLNCRRLDELLEECRCEVHAKQGRVWGHVAGVMAAKGQEFA